MEAPLSAETSIRLYASYDEAEPAWTALEARGGARHPFHRFAWLKIWQETIGQARAAAAAPAHLSRGDGAEALLPLSIETKGGLRRLVWAGDAVSDYMGPLSAPAGAFSAQELWEAVEKTAREARCDLVDLDKMPIGPETPAWPGARALHYHAHAMRVPSDVDAFLNAKLSSKERYNLRRAERQLAERGAPAFIVAAGPEEKADITERMIEFKHARYRATGALDPLNDPAVARFYRAAALCPSCGVHASLLRAGDAPVALHWGLSFDDTMYYLMPAFAPEGFDQLSPGTLFFVRFLRLCAACGISRLDFTVGDEDYKKKWRDSETSLCRLTAGQSAKGRAAARALRGIARLKANEKLRAAVQSLRAGLRKTRGLPASGKAAGENVRGKGKSS